MQFFGRHRATGPGLLCLHKSFITIDQIVLGENVIFLGGFIFFFSLNLFYCAFPFRFSYSLKEFVCGCKIVNIESISREES